MKNLKSVTGKPLIICVMLLLWSSTLFGQNSNNANPVKRYIQDGDTFTVFTIQGERLIASKVLAGQLCQERTIVVENALKSSEDLGKIQADLIKKEKEKSEAIRGQVVQQDIINNNLQTALNAEKARSDKFKRSRNRAWGIIGILAVALTVFIVK